MFKIFSKPNCTFCTQAKQLLESRDMSFEELVIDVGQEKQDGVTYVQAADLKALVPTARTVPQIFHNESHIGGFTELKRYLTENATL